jgi:RNA polymerase primary sigma factor
MAAPFTAEEEREIVERMRKGDRAARDRFIVANRPLVYSIARSFEGTRGQLSFEDLAAEGMVGLVEAADRFDPSRARFSTHAVYWIRMRMLRAIVDQAGPVRMIKSRAMRAAWWKIGRVLRQMFATGEAVSYDAVAERLALTPTDLRAIMATRAVAHASMDASRYVDEDESTTVTLGESMTADADPESTSADAAHRRAQAWDLARAVNHLTPRERRVLGATFADEPVELAELTVELGLSRRRIQQIKERAIAKLAYALPRGEDGGVRLSEARARLLEADAVDFSEEEE